MKETNRRKKILILAGGTGGHIFPALAVADELRQLGFEICWLGTEKGLETQLVKDRYPLFYLSVEQIRGKGFLNKLWGFWRSLIATGQAIKILKRLQPHLVLGMGGFSSGPGGLAAWILKKPLIIHEQNAVIGATNKILSYMANEKLAGFPGVFSKSDNHHVVGNPVRKEIINILPPRERFANRGNAEQTKENLRVLVMGGSQGAHAINVLMIETLKLCIDSSPIEIWHQTGEADFEWVEQQYRKLNVQAKVAKFIKEQDEAYLWCDVAIARAGALTVSELAAAGVASILIPFPYAASDHQYYNASYLEKAGAAYLFRQNNISPHQLLEIILELKNNRKKIIDMAEKAKNISKPHATQEAVNRCLSYLKQENRMKILNNSQIRRIHLMGIGGIGVSGLAEILLSKGYEVSGSDIANNALIERLIKRGVKVTLGHRPENIGDADALVYTSMIAPDNSEFLEAKKRNIPIMRRGELLAELMLGMENFIVAGTHGKTTTTSMLAYLFTQLGWDPTFVVGGVVNNLQSPAQLGQSRYFVAESDESDGSFLYLTPKIAIITNIDNDHLEYYGGSFETLKRSFLEFLNKIPADGCAILNWDDPNIREIAKQYTGKIIKTGFHPEADLRCTDYTQQGLQNHFIVHCGAKKTLPIVLNLPGQHNINNALGVIAVAELLNIPEEKLHEAFATFPGVKRRFYSHGEVAIKDGKVLLFDDYGHHPREINATIEAVRKVWPDRRFVMVFQPHRYTRTRDLMKEFANVLCQPDQLVLLEVYGAGENEIPGVNSSALCQSISSMGSKQPIFVSKVEELSQVLKKVLLPNDVVFFQGAGSVASLANTVPQQLID